MVALTVKVMDALCMEYPPSPTTKTVYVPGEPLQERVDVSDPPIWRLFAEKEQEMPLADALAERLTVAEKPYRRWRVMVELPKAFPAAWILVGSALRSKSCM